MCSSRRSGDALFDMLLIEEFRFCCFSKAFRGACIRVNCGRRHCIGTQLRYSSRCDDTANFRRIRRMVRSQFRRTEQVGQGLELQTRQTSIQTRSISLIYSRWLCMNNKDIVMIGLPLRSERDALLFPRILLPSRKAPSLMVHGRRFMLRLFELIARLTDFQRGFSLRTWTRPTFRAMHWKACGRPFDPAGGFEGGTIHRRRDWSFRKWQHRFVNSSQTKTNWLYSELTFKARETFVNVLRDTLVRRLRPNCPWCTVSVLQKLMKCLEAQSPLLDYRNHPSRSHRRLVWQCRAVRMPTDKENKVEWEWTSTKHSYLNDIGQGIFCHHHREWD